MNQGDIVALMTDAVYTALIVAAPMLVGGLLVGLIVSIFQATTQINEQTLSFVPKLIVILVVLVVCFGWMMTTLSDFTGRVYTFISSLGSM